MTDIGFIETRRGRLACRRRAGRGPTLIFLPGYLSDMEGGKASALDAWAEREGRAMLRFDYGGCGASPGNFREQILAGWRDDALAAIDSVEGRVVLVGSSMGGWLMLLAALARPERVAALVGIAAAPDFTAELLPRRLTPAQRRELDEAGAVVLPSDYDPAGYLYTKALVEDGDRHLLLGGPIP